MKAIWKYYLPREPRFSVQMPEGGEIVAVQDQAGTPCMWAKVDTGKPNETRYFALAGTGHELPEGDYVGTFQVPPFVFHIIEITPKGE